MKNRIRFLSLMLLVILFAVPCSVACAEQKTMMESKSEDDLMVFGLCTVKDTSYILYGSYDPSQPMCILSWTESQTEPELWAEGLIGCKSVSSLEQMAAESKPAEIIVEHAVCRLFTDGERLMSFNPWNGKVFVLSSVEIRSHKIGFHHEFRSYARKILLSVLPEARDFLQISRQDLLVRPDDISIRILFCQHIHD